MAPQMNRSTIDDPSGTVRATLAGAVIAVISALAVLVPVRAAGAQFSPDLSPSTTAGADGDRDEDGKDGRPSDGGADSPVNETFPGPRGSDDGGSSPVIPLLGGLLAGLVVGAVAATVAARRSVASAGGTGAPLAPPGVPDPAVQRAHDEQIASHAAQAQQAAAERSALVAALLEVIDTSNSDAVRTQVTERLAAVAVTPYEVPVGSLFDPSVHRGVQSAAAPSAEHNNLVAGNDRPGWVDRGTVLRQPEVVVYRWEAQ